MWTIALGIVAGYLLIMFLPYIALYVILMLVVSCVIGAVSTAVEIFKKKAR